MYSMTEELDRKVSETIVDIIQKQASCHLTKGEALASVYSVFGSVMGLVGNEVAELIEEAIRTMEAERPSPFPIYLQFHNGTYGTVSPDTITRKVTVRILAQDAKLVDYQCDSAGNTIKKALEIVKALIGKGAKRI